MESAGRIDITGKYQNGFKKNKGTALASLLLQSLISRALDDDEYVAMASLNLSAAFDIVDLPLLMKRLEIIGHLCGMPSMSLWSSLKFYISKDERTK